MKVRKNGWNFGEFVVIKYGENTNNQWGRLSERLIEVERQEYLKGEGKSKMGTKLKQMGLSKRQRRYARVDQEFALYLPLLNFRQKRVILSLIKLLASKQDQFLRQLHKDQKRAHEMKAELDNRYSAYKSGKTKMVSSVESKMRIGKILKTRKLK